MSLPIKSIPTLQGDSAKEFLEKADQNKKKRATVDFTEQLKIARAILEKSKLQ